jgi:uroporphyrinogen decarboxylase
VNLIKMTKRERVSAALADQPVDRPPVSAWRHFVAEEGSPETLAAATLDFHNTFDWDWIKINPRATYYAEAWGNTYDFSDYAGVYPLITGGPLATPGDLAAIRPVDPGAGVFGEQLELLKLVVGGAAGAHCLQTVFSPLSVLAFLSEALNPPSPAEHSVERVLGAHISGVRRLIDADPQGVHAALSTITQSLAAYSSLCIAAGASGIFYAIVRMARRAALSREQYTEFGVPYDLQLLQAVQGAPFNLLHICGPQVYFDQVIEYPVQAINWSTTGQGNPKLRLASQLTPMALVGGVDEELISTGTPEQVAAAARDALEVTGGRHFLLGPGCSIKPPIPEANLRALRQAVER